jgi:hypothetical protein
MGSQAPQEHEGEAGWTDLIPEVEQAARLGLVVPPLPHVAFAPLSQ